MPGCPKFAQYGWAHGFCKNHALLRGCRTPAKKSKAQSQVERAVAGKVEKSQAQSQVDSATKAKWALEGKIIEGRITSQSRKVEKRCSMFDEETELEGREDYEADYEKVLQGLEYP